MKNDTGTWSGGLAEWTEGAVDLSECPQRRRACRCLPKCRVCGFGKHMAVHGPAFGQPPGSEPYDHEFEPGTRADRD